MQFGRVAARRHRNKPKVLFAMVAWHCAFGVTVRSVEIIG